MLILFQCVSCSWLVEESEQVCNKGLSACLNIRSSRVCLKTNRKEPRSFLPMALAWGCPLARTLRWVCYELCPDVVTNGSSGTSKKQKPAMWKPQRQYAKL